MYNFGQGGTQKEHCYVSPNVEARCYVALRAQRHILLWINIQQRQQPQ